MTPRLRLMASAITLAFFTAPVAPVAAEEIDWDSVTFTFADERCRDADAAGVWCISKTEIVAIRDFVEESRFTFEEFVQENSLPRRTTLETKVPAFRFFVMGYNVL